jgi:hypothetical protein
MIPRRARAFAPFAAALLVSLLLGRFVIGAVLERAGRPAVPLDDAFIHFQYARRIAEGAPLRYTGDAISTGTTSLIWPALLAPFWKAGARGLSMVWVAWAFGAISLAGVAVDTGLLAKRLTSTTGGLIAGALCLAFGPFAWFAWSGMETMALAWVLVRTTRLAAEALDSDRAQPLKAGPRGQPSLLELCALGFIAPLLRPEGALVSLFAAAALAKRRPRLAPIPILGCAVLPALFFALTGDPAGSTARAKWLLHNPYYDAGRLLAQAGEHARLLLFDVLDGGEWTWVFVPRGLVLFFLFGAIALARSSRRAPWAAWLTLALCVGVLMTCSYQTFLWNRVRYVWPFVPAGFVLCACLSHELGRLLARVRPALEMAAPALGAALVARLAAQLPTAAEDLAQSAAAVDEQQVKLGEWARAALPEDAIIGVNDTGAIAYMAERRTFDIVGLTTRGQASAWVAGAGSRFERYERMPRQDLPTHFIVYPEWFGCDAVLGRELMRRTVLDHAILGGDTMVAYAADFTLLGSGATPVRGLEDEDLADEVDVADLESEAAHGFELGDARESDDVTRWEPSPDSEWIEGAAPEHEIIDGGRLNRAKDTFWVSAPAAPSRLVMRVAAEEPVTLRVSAGGEVAGSVVVPRAAWVELAVSLPPSSAARTRVDVVALDESGLPAPERARSRSRRFASFHYWIYAR